MTTDFRMARTPWQPTEKQRLFFWRMIEAMGVPLTEQDEGRMRRFWNRLMSADAGETVQWSGKFDRNPRYHRKYFALLNLGFESWEPEAPRVKTRFHGQPIVKHFETFRKNVIKLAGFYEVHYAVDGTLVLEAQSIAFANMDEVEFEELYNATVDVLLQHILTRYTRDDVDRVIDEVLAFAA